MRPLQGKIKMEYELNTNIANYDKSTAENCIKTHCLEGTPIPFNTNYCIGQIQDNNIILTPLRMAVQIRTNFDHADKEYESRRRKVKFVIIK